MKRVFKSEKEIENLFISDYDIGFRAGTESGIIQGRVDMMFDIAMDWIKQKYANDNYDQSVMERHMNFCLTGLNHSFSDLDYEIWCMMACIISVK